MTKNFARIAFLVISNLWESPPPRSCHHLQELCGPEVGLPITMKKPMRWMPRYITIAPKDSDFDAPSLTDIIVDDTNLLLDP